MTLKGTNLNRIPKKTRKDNLLTDLICCTDMKMSLPNLKIAGVSIFSMRLTQSANGNRQMGFKSLRFQNVIPEETHCIPEDEVPEEVRDPNEAIPGNNLSIIRFR
jgi:hypothetical protein